MNLTIIDASYHRNGVCGIGFYAVLFEDHDAQDAKDKLKVASLFDERGYCAVYSVERLTEKNVAFARGNSWRGDQFEAALRPLVEAFNASGSNRMGPFSIPPADVLEKQLNDFKAKAEGRNA